MLDAKNKEQANKPKRVLSTFGLVMINIIAIDNLRSLPFSAEYGLSLLTYYLIAMFLFFLPVAFVSAELATAFPARGGIYVWVRTALGERFALFVIWLQWIYNVLWYPAILTFVAGALTGLIGASWVHTRTYYFVVVVGLFWLATWVNGYGMRISSWVSSIGAILGTLFPMCLIIVLAGCWLWGKQPMHIALSWHALQPHIASWQDMYFFIGIIFGLIGIEMSAVHAEEVTQPRRAYPRSILWSCVIIFCSLVLSSLAIAVVVPQRHLNVITGLSQGFEVYLSAFHLMLLKPLILALIVLGSLSSVATWIIGPSKGLLVAAKAQMIPSWFAKENAQGVPVRILLIQAIVVTGIAGFFWVLPSIDTVYLMLTVVSTQLALLPYIILFVVAMRLRGNRQRCADAYTIPGGKWGIAVLSVLGIAMCSAVLILGFYPPPGLEGVVITHYMVAAAVLLVILCVPPFILEYVSRFHR